MSMAFSVYDMRLGKQVSLTQYVYLAVSCPQNTNIERKEKE